MKKKIFAVSDIHGHYTEMRSALDEAGFSPDNDGHLLIVCGDCFDRGEENRAVLEYLNSVQNKILIKGNHEDMLRNALRTEQITGDDVYNSLDITLMEFFGADVFDRRGRLNFIGREDILNALIRHIDGMCDYFETENYLFTHGWLPSEYAKDGFRVIEGYRHQTPDLWVRGRITPWTQMYAEGATLEGKTIVCGHRAARYGSRFDPSRNADDSHIFYGNGMIAIDALTVQSGRVNVLMLEDDISVQTHRMNLKKEPFLQMRDGKKRVEMRLFDEKRQAICIGDEIVFIEEESGETLRAAVIGLHVYPNFSMMSWNFENECLGVPSDIAVGDYMRAFYSDDAVYQNGALAIRLRMLL